MRKYNNREGIYIYIYIYIQSHNLALVKITLILMLAPFSAFQHINFRDKMNEREENR